MANIQLEEYVPHYVSIGPYHRISSPKLARDVDKVHRLGEVLSAAAAYSTAPLRLEDFITELALMEHAVRSCYRHPFDVASKDFLRWMLLDACYILVRFGDVLRRRHGEEEEERTVEAVNGVMVRRWYRNLFRVPSKGFLRRVLLDACCVLVRLGDVVGLGRRRLKVPAAAEANGFASGENRVVPSVEREESGVDQQEAVAVVRDVFYLAENQIPFFVVDKVHQMTFLDSKTPALKAIAGYAAALLEGQQYSIATPTKVEEPERPPEPANLLHLLHMHFKPTVLTPSTAGGRPVGRWRTAIEYYFAGVTFKKRPLDLSAKGGARCILDVKVSSGGGTLEVPQLNIDAETWRLLRNLMALEQSTPVGAGSHVTAYCVFMSQLASTDTDVELLSRRGGIVPGLRHHSEVAGHFANLCKGAVFDADDAEQNYLRPVCQKLERRFRSRPRRWMTWLKKKYFANPWLAAGLVAATVGLICSVIQAVYSVLGYVK
uniref:Uncharacterized protein n=1 Tax=Oryza brachyantha TaxID=4533 RepID=J3MSG4_ORYBR